MDHGLLAHVKTVGDHLERRLRTLGAEASGDSRGARRRLMRGVDLRIDAAPVIELARQQGLLVNRTSETVVRLLPPLTIEAADIDAGIDVLDAVLMTVATEVPA
jgi:acetylornithine/succinyldiaminopimelate/putrescine aminotransferase